MKKYFLMGLLGLLIIIPSIPIVKGAEKDVYLNPFTHYGFYVSLPNGFTLNWEFETHNNSFLANVRIDDSEGHYSNLANGVEQGSGSYPITKDDSYYITLYNIDGNMISGYIRFTYNDPPLTISGFIPLLMIGIIGLLILITVRRIKVKFSFP